MSDIRKWFMKQHDKGTNSAKPTTKDNVPEKSSSSTPETSVDVAQESTVRRKTSKYFATNKQNQKDEKEVVELPAKRKVQKDSGDLSSDVKPPPPKKLHKDDDDDDFVCLNSKKAPVEVTPSKKLKSSSSRGVGQKPLDIDDIDEDEVGNTDSKSNLKSAGRGRGVRSKSAAKDGGRAMEIDSDEEDADDKSAKALKSNGRGRGGRGATTVAAGGRGRGGGGRGGFMNFGERKDPPHKGEKEVPEGAPDCLSGLTFVISGTLDSLEREEAEDLIKRHGGRVTGSVSKKTNYLLCDEDIGGRKSSKAKELGTGILTEDGLFDLIRASIRSKPTAKKDLEKSPEKSTSLLKESPQKSGMKKDIVRKSSEGITSKGPTPVATPIKQKGRLSPHAWLPWTEKYKPKVPNDIVGNQSKVKQLDEWLKLWNDQFLGKSNKGKMKKVADAGAKKAVLLSGTPGIGKTTSAKLISQMLGFQTIEVNASDSRGKADAKVDKGIGGSTSNSVKELVSNQALSANMVRSPKHPKVVLIMDEVDGMSAGDRGGVADLIASIKISKIPIICICNDRYSQKLKSLMNYCLQINFQKPTKQQMAKRLSQIAKAEGLEVNEVALEELAERVNGDMRMALNQLQYMSLSMSVIKYDDIRQRLNSSSKDEDISPFTAVDNPLSPKKQTLPFTAFTGVLIEHLDAPLINVRLFGYNAGKLRMDERIDLSMSDPDLVPLLIQENYMNYRPSASGKDDNGLKRMKLIARAAESIADGDIINVQIRRYRQWQLSQSSVLTSCLIPAALLHGQREILEQGERNFNRFGGWLGKNSTMGKNYRLLEDLHVHLLASRESNLGRTTLRTDYLSLLLKHLTDPLKMLPKDEAVEKVVEFMDSYSISQEDFDSIMDISKFQGRPNPLDGVQPAVKSALTRAYNKGSKGRVIRVADLITLPGIKKAPKKRVAAMLEPVDDGLVEEKGDELAENEEENTSDTEDRGTADSKKSAQMNLQSLNSKGIVVEMDLKGGGTSAKKAPAGRGRGGGRGSSSGAAPKRKR